MPRRNRRYRRQAEEAAALRSAPQRSALAQTILELRSQRDTEVAGAGEARQAIQGSIRQVRPEVSRVYDESSRGLGAVNQILRGDLERYGGGAASGAIAAAHIAQQSASQARNLEARASALQELTDRHQSAAENQVFQSRSANARFQSELGKIGQQLTALAAEEGQAASSIYGDILEAAAGRSVTRRGQTLTARERAADRRSRERQAELGRQSRERTARRGGRGGGGSGGGPSWKPPAEQSKAQSQIDQAIEQARLLTGGKKDRGQRQTVADTLLEGVPSYTNDKGQKLPAIPRFDPLFVSAALDVYFDGGLSRKTVNRLHTRRYQVRPLGYRTAPRQRARTGGGILTPGPGGQLRPN